MEKKLAVLTLLVLLGGAGVVFISCSDNNPISPSGGGNGIIAENSTSTPTSTPTSTATTTPTATFFLGFPTPTPTPKA